MRDTPVTLAEALVADLGSPADAIEWLEDQLARADQRDAPTWCNLIDAVEARGGARLH